MRYLKSLLYSLCILFLCITFLEHKTFAQSSIQKDTSYTAASALVKVNKKYPDAELIKPYDNLNINMVRNLPYVDYDGRELHLDLFSPTESTNDLPLVILIHGGGWASGDKSLMTPLAQNIADEGYVTAAIEYRLSPEAKYPAAAIDIKNAIKFLKSNASIYGVDTSKVTLLGCSAGGHLAAMAGVTADMKKYALQNQYENISDRVQAIIDIDGVLDFTHPAESGKDTNDAKPSVGKRWLGSSYKDNPEIWREVSPVNYVSDDTPPILFINSSRERFHAGRDEMIEKMNEFNIYSEVHTLEDSPHSFWLFSPWFTPTKSYVIDFLNKMFK